MFIRSPLLYHTSPHRNTTHFNAKMQSSITMFFKSKDKPAESSSDNITKADAKSSRSTPSKRTADDCTDSASVKRQAIAKDDVSTPTKMSTKANNVSTPEVKISQASNLLSPTPQKDATLAVIKSKISAGAFALHENIGRSWFRALQGEFDKPYFRKLSSFVKQQRDQHTVFPPEHKVYTWTRFHDIRDTRVIILGQDPYHGPNQAHGLSFSVQKGVRIPPSLVNIFKELEADIPNFKSPCSGDLTGWAKQGVLMLNTCLTVNQGNANSHQGKGWETFTDSVISWLSKNTNHKLVFMLWGRPAQRKTGLIDKRHLTLTSAHPSPLSAHNGFFGCKHFSKANEFLLKQKLPEIDWSAL